MKSSARVRGVSVAYDQWYQWLSIRARNPKVWGLIPHGDSEFFRARDKTKNIFLYFVTKLKTYHLYNSIHELYTIDIADSSSMQDSFDMNFVIGLAHPGVSVV